MLVDGKRSFGMAVNASPSRSVLSRNQYSEDRSQPKEDGNKDKQRLLYGVHLFLSKSTWPLPSF